MQFTAKQIADFLNGTVDGDPDVSVSNISRIEEGKPQTLTFLANPKYGKYIYTTEASIVLVQNDFTPEKPIRPTMIRVPDPYSAFAALLHLVQQTMQKQKAGISLTAAIHESVAFDDKAGVWIGDYAVIGERVKIGRNVKIYPHAFIDDDCTIGENTVIYSGVKIYDRTVVGSDCVIHSGVVLGSDGFGFAPMPDGTYSKIPQLGNVVIENAVEIGSNTSVDRATIGSTIIRSGTKLDNLIQVAHNVEIGKNTVVASQAGFSGSSKIGEHCMIGGQAGISGHIKIGNKVSIAAQSGIASDVDDNSEIMGSPAFDAFKYKRAFVLFKNIDDLHKRLIGLEKMIKKFNKSCIFAAEMEKQKTISRLPEIQGKGLHTGKDVTMKFLPGEPGQGVVFRRTDLSGDNTIKAIVDYVTDTSRGTTISNGYVTIRTIEHLLAAIAGMQVDNITIELSDEEIPINDGSAKSYIEMLESAGIIEQNAERKVYKLNKPFIVTDEEKDVHISLEPSEKLTISCTIDYKTHIIPPQHVVLDRIEDFQKLFAPARTFAFLHEIEPMLKKGLIRGGHLQNAIIFIDHLISEEEQQRLINYFNMPDIRVREEGILNNVELRFDNEPARHKLIDILGDLTLVGMPFTGNIKAYRPGHKTNTEFAKMIRKHLMNGI